jgi:hypothetical protein
VTKVFNPLRDTAQKNAQSKLASLIFSSNVNQEQLELMSEGFQEACALHEGLLTDLERTLERYGPQVSIADAFTELLSRLGETYLGFCDRMFIAIKTYEGLYESKKDFRKFLEALKGESHQYYTTLPTFGSAPREHFKVYVRHIKAIFKNTDKETEWGVIERDRLKDCGKRIEEFDSLIGQTMRTPEEAQGMIEAQARLADLNVHKQFRVCIKIGTLQKVSRKAVQKRLYALFSDILVYGEIGLVGNKASVKGVIDLGPTWIQDALDTQRMRNAFQIVAKDKTYVVMADTPAEKTDWMTKIQRAVDALVRSHPEYKEQRSAAKVEDASGIYKLFTLSSSDTGIDSKTEVPPEPDQGPQKEVGEVKHDYEKMALGAMVQAT